MESLLVAQNEEEMIALGTEFAEKLEAGTVLALVGDLGAGKTHFTKGIATGLDSDDLVTSPTFSLVNEYRSGSIPVFHFDFYRMETIDELEQIGWEEYFDEAGVMVVEWADKFPQSLPDDETTIWCWFSVNETTQARTIRVEKG